MNPRFRRTRRSSRRAKSRIQFDVRGAWGRSSLRVWGGGGGGGGGGLAGFCARHGSWRQLFWCVAGRWRCRVCGGFIPRQQLGELCPRPSSTYVGPLARWLPYGCRAPLSRNNARAGQIGGRKSGVGVFSRRVAGFFWGAGGPF